MVGVIRGRSSRVRRLFARSFDGIRAVVIATDAAAVYPLADIAGALAWNVANSGKVLLRAGAVTPRGSGYRWGQSAE